MLLRRITKHVKEQNWFAVGLDFLIVVLGILIAFQITNWSEGRQQSSQTAQALKAVEADLTLLMFVSSERWANEPCRVQTIRTLSEKLAEDGEEWDPDIEVWLGSRYTSFALPNILRTPRRPWSDTAWETLLASDAALHLDRAKFDRLSILFSIAKRTDELDKLAWQLRGRLSHLALPGKMSSAERRAALATLGEVSAIGDAILINAGYIQSEVSNLDFEFEDAKQILLRSFGGLSDAIQSSQTVYGECIDIEEYQTLIDLFYTAEDDPKTVQELLGATP